MALMKSTPPAMPSSSIHTSKPCSSRNALSLRANGVLSSPRAYDRNSLLLPPWAVALAAMAAAAAAEAVGFLRLVAAWLLLSSSTLAKICLR